MRKLLGVAVIASTAAAAAYAAQPAAPPVPPAPMADHVMDRAEVQAMVRDHFGRLDADHDGAITTEEVAQLHGRMGDHAMAEHMDHDGPGMTMHEGPIGDPAKAFDRLDSNKDGMISRDEFAKGRQVRIEKRIVMNGPEGAGRDGAMRQMKIHRGGGMMGGRMIVMADGNHDGRITLAEAEAMALQHFDQMDSNHDGRVTPEERRAGRPLIIKEIREKRTAG